MTTQQPRDLVVTVPKGRWAEWIAEGDLPDTPWTGNGSHFFIPRGALPITAPGARVYIVSHGRVRGWAPLLRVEQRCQLDPSRACLLRLGDAHAVTIDRFIRGFQGWRYRDWERDEEVPFPNWQKAWVL